MIIDWEIERNFTENKMDGLQSFDGPDTSYNDHRSQEKETKNVAELCEELKQLISEEFEK